MNVCNYNTDHIDSSECVAIVWYITMQLWKVKEENTLYITQVKNHLFSLTTLSDILMQNVGEKLHTTIDFNLVYRFGVNIAYIKSYCI